jgi:O-antigen/teichoic acid export membrane protein
MAFPKYLRPELDSGDNAGRLRWTRAIRGGLVGAGGQVLALGLAFIVTPVAIDKAGNTTYGLFAAITAFATLLGFGDFGIGNGVIGEIVRSRAVADAEGERATIRSALGLLTVLGAGVAAIGTAAAFAVPWRVLLRAPTASDTTIRYTVATAAICTGLAIPGALSQKVYLGRQQPGRTNLWINGGNVLGSIALLLASLSGHHLPLMVAAQLGVPAVVGLASLAWLDGRHGLRLDVRRASLARTRTLLRSGRLFAILQIAAVINFEIDNLVVARFLGPKNVTTFSATSRLFAVPLVVSSLFFTPLWAAFADAVTRHDSRWLRSAYRRSTSLAFMCLTPAAIVLALTGRSAVHAWTRGAVDSPKSLVIAMSLWIVMFAFNQPQAMLLNALHAEKFQLWAATANVALNLTLSVLFTSHFGVSGPIWGTVVAQALCAIVPTTIYLRHLNIGEPR